MSKWKTVRLGDVLIQQDKSKIKAGEGIDDGVYPFYTCSNELTKQINTAQYKGPALIFGTGGKASVHFCSGSFSTSTDCLVYKTSKEVNLSLVNKYLRKNMYLLENGFKGAGLKHISREYIANIEISLPEILEQNKLDSQFDLIESSITNHKKMLEKYDTLIKSRFIEMFGDPVTNSKNWNLTKLGDLLESIRYGTSTPPVFSETGYAFIRATNIKKGKIVNDDMKYISEEEAKKISKCKLNGNEILIVRSGVNSGDTCVVTKEYINQYAGYDMILVLGNQINPIYLNELLNTNYMEKMIKPLTRRAAQPHLNSEQTQSLPIILPPLSLQNDFATFVQQIDKSKFAVQKSLEKAETLYKSLMQEYFG